MEHVESKRDHVFEAFKSSFPKFHNVLQHQLKSSYPDLPEASFSWINRMTEYNVPHGKLIRGSLAIEAFRDLATANMFDNHLDEINCLGWCIEWLQAFFLVADDVMDQSLTRRGQPCWYKVPDVGLIAINDALILKSSINVLLKHQFYNNPKYQTTDIYNRLTELFREIEMATEIGQLLDLTSARLPDSSVQDLKLKYDCIVKYKTALYSFYLPFACAHILANPRDVESVDDIKDEKLILSEIGRLFQVQDDYLDAFGDPRITGKLGTDINEGKCTWLLCRFLEKSCNQDRQILFQNYGKPFHNHAAKEVVLSLYEKYSISSDFIEFERDARDKIEKSISNLSKKPSAAVLKRFLLKIVQRVK